MIPQLSPRQRRARRAERNAVNQLSIIEAAPHVGRKQKSGAVWPLAAILLLLALQFTLIFTRAINWDEYSHWRQVAWFAQGVLDRPLQTFHVRMFAWLAGSFETSVDHIVATRVFMFGFEVLAMVSLFLVARRFADRTTALLVPLMYISAGYVFQHGTSFRYDPMSAGLLCAALAALTRERLDLPQSLAFAACAALASVITIKTVLYAPAFAGVFAWRWLEAQDRRGEAVRLGAAVAMCGAIFAALLIWHASGVSDANGAIAQGERSLGRAGEWVFSLGVPLYWPMMLKSAALAPVLTALIALAPFAIVRNLSRLSHKLLFGGFWLMLLTLLFYRNTAAYFYVFLLAPLSLATIPVLRVATQKYGAKLMVLALASVTLAVFATEDRSVIDRQRQVERNVHEIFAEPVTYFDDNFMLGGWPKANKFLTPWTMHFYKQEGIPTFRRAMEQRKVPLLLVNSRLLQFALAGQDDLLLAEDTSALRDNYVPFSWPIWIAGKDFSDRSGAFEEEFLVPGDYTLKGGAVVIDGTPYSAGDKIGIGRGMHRIAIEEGSRAQLVWGDNLRQPSQPLEPGPLYVEF